MPRRPTAQRPSRVSLATHLTAISGQAGEDGETGRVLSRGRKLLPSGRAPTTLVQEIVSETWWAPAVSLQDRLPLPVDSALADFSPERTAIAHQRLRRWQASFDSDLDDHTLYLDWLDRTNLNETQLVYLLAEPPEKLRSRLVKVPQWVKVFANAYTRYSVPAVDPNAGLQGRPGQSHRHVRGKSAQMSKSLHTGVDPQIVELAISRALKANGMATDVAISRALKANGMATDVETGKSTPTAERLPGSSPDVSQANVDLRPLLTVIEPVLRRAATHVLARCWPNPLRSEIDPKSDRLAVDHLEVLTSWLEILCEQLLEMLSRTLVLSLRVALQQGRLTRTADATELLQSYSGYLHQPTHALDFFTTYPVLAKEVIRCATQWELSTGECYARLVRDWPLLSRTFWNDSSPGPLVAVSSQLGDRHRNGRAVQVLTFGSGRRLVYKPRSLAVEAHTQELCSWLNAHGAEPPWQPLSILDRRDGHGAYGWMEWVTAGACQSEDEVARFYQRQGANLALLYILAAVDIHHGNLIAAGEHPFLIDLETLLQAPPDVDRSQLLTSAERLAFEHVESSVLRTLLLPARRMMSERGEGKTSSIEISGLGGAPGQSVPDAALSLQGWDRGEPQFQTDMGMLTSSAHRPQLAEREIDPRAYLAEVLDGFTHTYRLLMMHRRELVARTGPLPAFQRDTTRVVLRATEHYTRLQIMRMHPYMLRDALDQEGLLHVLWQAGIYRKSLPRVVKYEQADLSRGDIPYFSTHVSSHALWPSRGRQIPGFFDRTGLEVLRARIHNLSEADLARQRWFIQASFTALAPDEGIGPSSTTQDGRPAGGQMTRTSSVHVSAIGAIHPPASVPEVGSILSSDELMGQARLLGDRLCDLATSTDENATWLGVYYRDGGEWDMTIADLNLYNGLSGIALALAYLGAVTGEERYTHMARAGLITLQKRLADGGPQLQEENTIGYFSGWGGVLAALTHLAVLWHDARILDEAVQLVDRIEALIPEDTGLDLMRGSAGAIAGLLTLVPHAPSAKVARHLNKVLRACGEHLAATAVTPSSGRGWRGPMGEVPLTGMSHGAAGFAWALLKLSIHLDHQGYRQLARDVLAYERSAFDSTEQNWRDLRPTLLGEPITYRVAWCHGAPGIGLARLDMLNLVRDALGTDEYEVCLAEIRSALKTTAAIGCVGIHALCHGDLGNVETLYRGQLVLGEPRWQATYELQKANIVAEAHTYGWRCSTPHGVETPGLMLGLAGMSLQLLRLAEPSRVPSLLTMQGPVDAARTAGTEQV